MEDNAHFNQHKKWSSIISRRFQVWKFKWDTECQNRVVCYVMCSNCSPMQTQSWNLFCRCPSVWSGLLHSFHSSTKCCCNWLLFSEICWWVVSYKCNWLESTGFYGVWRFHGQWTSHKFACAVLFLFLYFPTLRGFLLCYVIVFVWWVIVDSVEGIPRECRPRKSSGFRCSVHHWLLAIRHIQNIS